MFLLSFLQRRLRGLRGGRTMISKPSVALASLTLAIWFASGQPVGAGMLKPPLPTSMNGGVTGPGLGFANVVNAALTGVNNDNKNVKGDSFVSFDLLFDKTDFIDIVFRVTNSGGFMPMQNAREDQKRNPCNNDPCGTTEYWWESAVVNNS